MIAFESIAKPLLVIHALFAVALLGSAGHLGYESFRMLIGRPRNLRLAQIHARVGFVLYAITFVLGLVIYPTFRVRVRHDHFDGEMPWATNLFDTKEYLAAFGLAAFAAIFLFSFAVQPRDDADRAMRPAVASLGILIACVTLFSAVVGLVLVSYRSI